MGLRGKCKKIAEIIYNNVAEGVETMVFIDAVVFVLTIRNFTSGNKKASAAAEAFWDIKGNDYLTNSLTTLLPRLTM